MENLMALQGAKHTGDSTFFTRSSRPSSKGKKQHHEQNRDYIQKLKSRTRCFYNVAQAGSIILLFDFESLHLRQVL